MSERDPVRARVEVIGDARTVQPGGLLSKLASLMPISFAERHFDSTLSSEEANAVLALVRPGHPAGHLATCGVPCFTAPGAFVLDKASPRSTIEVQFSCSEEVPIPFRGRRITTSCAHQCTPLTLAPLERALATDATGVLWSVSERQGAKHYRSALPLLDASVDIPFDDVFSGDRFIENLPLLHFLRTELDACAYDNAPLRASFIFDDPNLHWARYGFIDFHAIAARAKRHNFHVAFATIPLDAWYTNPQTARIFRDHVGQLSLLVHGNNHSKRELAQHVVPGEGVALARQALSRIERLEVKSGLGVCRVMVPPHGACSDTMLGCLDLAGFEAACISSGSLRHHNPTMAWAATLGFHPAEQLNGISVLPRWSFEGNVENTILVAAYLGRPLVLRGHHQELRQGYEVLDRLAGMINGLGPVVWTKLTDLSRMSFRHRLYSGLYRVVPFAKRINMVLPDEAEQLLIEDDPNSGAGSGFLVRNRDAAGEVRSGVPIDLAPGTRRTIDISRICIPRPAPAVGWPATAPKVMLRRFLTESRDRLMMQGS